MTRKQHLGFIDQLRGLAILLVAAGHVFAYAGATYQAPFSTIHPSRDPSTVTGFIATSIFCNGFLGVLLFFGLSGFCIRWSHLHATRFSLKDFYLRRAFRIYPAYLVWLGIFAVLASAPAWDITVHALLIHNFTIASFYSINPPFWSIALEWQIYLIYPLIVWISRRVDSRFILIGTALTGVGAGMLGTTTVQNLFHSNLPAVLSVLPFWLLFPWMLGFYQAERLYSGKALKTIGWWWIALIPTTLLVESYPKIHVFRVVLWSIVASQVLALWCRYASKLTSKPFQALGFIGVVSYSIYLGHDLVARFYPAIERALSLPRSSFLGGVIASLVCLPLFILIGWVSYHLFEKPGIQASYFFRKHLIAKKSLEEPGV
ncbi:MAG: acyltransferase [Luteolibacter sp.]